MRRGSRLFPTNRGAGPQAPPAYMGASSDSSQYKMTPAQAIAINWSESEQLRCTHICLYSLQLCKTATCSYLVIEGGYELACVTTVILYSSHNKSPVDFLANSGNARDLAPFYRLWPIRPSSGVKFLQRYLG